MPGFKLAALCAELYARERGPQTIGMVLMNHGIFTWGDTARESYERMIEHGLAGRGVHRGEHVANRTRFERAAEHVFTR